MDGLERRGLRPRIHNRDVQVPEARRIRDVPFAKRCSARSSVSRIPIRFRGIGPPAARASEMAWNLRRNSHESRGTHGLSRTRASCGHVDPSGFGRNRRADARMAAKRRLRQGATFFARLWPATMRGAFLALHAGCEIPITCPRALRRNAPARSNACLGPHVEACKSVSRKSPGPRPASAP
jgi:hypothetical protein